MRRSIFLILSLTCFLLLPRLSDCSSLDKSNSNREQWLSPEPIRLAMANSVAGDEWDDEIELTKATKDNPPGNGGRKSRAKAIILSALIPGAGELYLGQKDKARYFLVGEALTLAGFFWFNTNASWRRDDLIRYGNAHAGASLDGKPDSFLDMVGFYSNNYHYNSEGRVGDPHRPYYPDNDEYHWAWQSEEERLAYKELQNAETTAIKRSQYMLGLALVNRILSVIDTAVSSRKMGSGEFDEFSASKPDQLKFSLNPISPDRQLVLTWHTSLF